MIDKHPRRSKKRSVACSEESRARFADAWITIPPIESISWGRKGARDTIRIDPFKTGDNTEIPVNSDQYHVLRKSGSDSCVAVMQRKSASGAVEIKTNGGYMCNKPDDVPVTRCGFSESHVGPAVTGSGNPWSKD